MRYFICLIFFTPVILIAQAPHQEKLYLSEFALEKGDTTRAIDLLKEYLRDKPESIAGALRLAEIYYRQEELSKSISYCNIAIDLLKDQEKKHTAFPYEEGVDSAKGNRHYLLYQKVKKDMASLYQLAGRIRQKQALWDMAETNYNIAFDYYPFNESILVDQANLHIEKGEYPSAQRLLFTAENMNPLNPAIAYNLGFMHLQMEDTANAISNFKKSIAQDSSFKAAWRSLARVYYGNEQYGEAIPYYSGLLQTDSVDLEALYNRAFAYKQTGNNEAAVNDWQVIIEHYPDQIEVIRYQGLTYMEMRRYPAAINSFNRYIRKKPEERLGYLNRGYIYMILEEYEPAHRDFDKLIEMNVTDAQAYYYKSYAYALKGKKRKACKTFDTAIGLGYDEKQVDDILIKLCN